MTIASPTNLHEVSGSELKPPAVDRPSAVVIDAGVGNLGNLVRALRHAGAEAEITRDPVTIAAARNLVLPGVGAFRPPREALRGPLEEALQAALAHGAWLLGICVGYQLLFEAGEEFGTTDGLGLLPGTVVSLPDSVPLPHIGWNRLCAEVEHPLLAGIPRGAYVYFVHSFAPQNTPREVRIANAVHGRPFTAIAGKGRVFGTQFHPEKSGRHGLRLLRNYLEMVRCN